MKHRFAEMILFDTCTHKCAYCHFAESGKVLDNSQINPFRDPAFIDLITGFFNRRTTESDKWTITLTGGEPLLMPNLRRFVDALGTHGNKVAYYTALLIGENHPAYQYLLESARYTDYIIASFHHEAEAIEDEFFDRVKRLKQAGHSIIFRLVGHPSRLHRLDELAARCREINVAFNPITLFSPDFPKSYSAEEKAAILRFATSISQIIQIEGGLDTTTTRCTAGSALISIDMRTGRIKPCISVHNPEIGNIYDDTLDLFERPIACPGAGKVSCTCEIHFQQGIVAGADDQKHFEREKRGYVAPVALNQLKREIDEGRLRFSTCLPGIGQTKTAGLLSLETSEVKAAHAKHRSYFEGAYAAENHPEFKLRQFP
jgi:organic radical activating enzyme